MTLSPFHALCVFLLFFRILDIRAVSVHIGSHSPEHDKFYIYDWPELIDRYANFTDRDIGSHGVEVPEWKTNFGAGRLIDIDNLEYKTSQFSLFKLIYERALLDPRRTLDPSEATTFFIPFDIGMHICFLEANGRMRRSGCPLADDVQARLNQLPYFRHKGGHDHLVIFSINYNMNYFMNAAKCQQFMHMCWNCTKLSIDEYLFTAKHRMFEAKNRGINWHGVPFPSDYHFNSMAAKRLLKQQQQHAHISKSESLESVANAASNWALPWQRLVSQEEDEASLSFLGPLPRYNRPILVSFTGSPRRFNEYSTLMREALIKQCSAMNDTSLCSHGRYGHSAKWTNNELSRKSVFCLQPPGDMPSRKSVFDSVLSGCIPVLFHPLTARYMYEWHWGQTQWEDIAISFDSTAENKQLMNGSVNFIQRLVEMFTSSSHASVATRKGEAAVSNEDIVARVLAGGLQEVRRRQKKMAEVAHQLQYSLIEEDPDTKQKSVARLSLQSAGGANGVDYVDDAYDIALKHVLGIHSGRETHERTSHFVTCDLIGGKQELQTADWCVSTNSLQDPYKPPAYEYWK